MLRAGAKLQARAVAAAAKTLASDPDDPAFEPVDMPRTSNLVLRKDGGDAIPKARVSGDTCLRDCPSDNEKHPATGIRGKPDFDGGGPHPDDLRLDNLAGEPVPEEQVRAGLLDLF